MYKPATPSAAIVYAQTLNVSKIVAQSLAHAKKHALAIYEHLLVIYAYH